jgi:hypothetical protein
MSVLCIDKIIRNHTGPNASDTVKITHDEVVAMLKCADDRGTVYQRDRAELMAALNMFGGNSMHPDIFSSAADKEALATMAMQGIETAAKFSTLTPGAQVAFIYNCLIIGSGNTVGFTTVAAPINKLPASIQALLQDIFDAEKKKLGASYTEGPFCSSMSYFRKGEAYAYAISAGWFKADQASWNMEVYLGSTGELLKSTGSYSPPDDDE